MSAGSIQTYFHLCTDGRSCHFPGGSRTRMGLDSQLMERDSTRLFVSELGESRLRRQEAQDVRLPKIRGEAYSSVYRLALFLLGVVGGEHIFRVVFRLDFRLDASVCCYRFAVWRVRRTWIAGWCCRHRSELARRGEFYRRVAMKLTKMMKRRRKKPGSRKPVRIRTRGNHGFCDGFSIRPCSGPSKTPALGPMVPCAHPTCMRALTVKNWGGAANVTCE